jgi:hypothetical protein
MSIEPKFKIETRMAKPTATSAAATSHRERQKFVLVHLGDR